MAGDRRRAWRGVGWIIVGLALAGPQDARGQIPGLPGTSAPSAPAKKSGAGDKPIPAPTKDNPKATVAVTSGPIDVTKPVDDQAIRRTLEELLPKYPGVRSVRVQVEDGAVTLEGQVDDDDTLDDVTAFVEKVRGVRLVLNRMNTDAEVMTAREMAAKVLGEYRDVIARKWLLALMALGIVMATALLARLFGRYSETLLAPFVRNVMLRSVVGSLISSLILIGGLMMALWMLNLTHAVLSILGLSAVVGLAVGFAFRDITENFIASVLLGVRRPFQVGDYITVAGQSGVVKSLNTRATVLVTLEGNHVRIPNATIFKEILVNASASPSSRGTFDVTIPHEASASEAMQAIGKALAEQEGVLAYPPPRALVDGLEANGVRLRVYFWSPTSGVDRFKLASDVKLRAKVALQKLGIVPPPAGMLLTVAGRVPVQVIESDGHAPHAEGRACPVVSPEQAHANLMTDTRAADAASPVPKNGRSTPMEHVLSEAETRVSDEGDNLLANGKGE
jgi:small-conductance mechanosensitive channel